MLLCGAATALAGPIGFVGLVVPHAVRVLIGPDYRWMLPLSLVLAPVLLLVADVVGRVILLPGEVPAGIMTAVIGAPVFVWLVRRGRGPGCEPGDLAASRASWETTPPRSRPGRSRPRSAPTGCRCADGRP